MNGLLTAAEAATILKIHINTVYGYLETGKIKGHRIVGNRWRIKSEDFKAFVEEEMKCPKCGSIQVTGCHGGTKVQNDPTIHYICTECLTEF